MAGICGSELHIYPGRESGLDPGTVMGHEFVGIVEETGTEVKKFKKGARVLSPFTTSCGECFYCLIGLTCRCEKGNLFGWCKIAMASRERKPVIFVCQLPTALSCP